MRQLGWRKKSKSICALQRSSTSDLRMSEANLWNGSIWTFTRFVNIFFREERLPIEEGWVRSEIPITGTLIARTALNVEAASEWPGPNSNCSELVIGPSGITQNLQGLFS